MRGNNYTSGDRADDGDGVAAIDLLRSEHRGGNNTVTVTFNQAAVYPDVRILEYRGVTTLDATAGASGNSGTAEQRCGDDDECQRVDLWSEHGDTATGAAGSGFTTRVITSPDGDIAEDKVVTTAGSNSATATLTSSGPWVMQMVTFSAASGPVPTVGSVAPNSGPTVGRNGSDDHGHELCRGSDGDVWRCGRDQRGGGE